MDHPRISYGQLEQLKQWLPKDVIRELSNSTDPDIIDYWLDPAGDAPKGYQIDRLLLAYKCYLEIKMRFGDDKAAKLWFVTPGTIRSGKTPARALHDGDLQDVETALTDMTKP